MCRMRVKYIKVMPRSDRSSRSPLIAKSLRCLATSHIWKRPSEKKCIQAILLVRGRGGDPLRKSFRCHLGFAPRGSGVAGGVHNAYNRACTASKLSPWEGTEPTFGTCTRRALEIRSQSVGGSGQRPNRAGFGPNIKHR
jgi:hypothetical protein